MRAWYLVHRWSSLVCTLFLLLMCITGLPLVFADELEAIAASGPEPVPLARGEEGAGIDPMLAAARARYPREVVRFVFLDAEEAAVKVVMAPADSPRRDLDHRIVFDARTGTLREDEHAPALHPAGPLDVLRRLHTDLYAGTAGELLLGGMGLLFAVATVSGVVLYGPFMQKLAFGTVRRQAPRLRWLDMHNLLGICFAAWALVVGLTGVLNELAQPLSAHWRRTGMQQLLGSTPGAARAVAPAGSAQAALLAVRQALPDRNVTSLILPSRSFSNPGHYLVWTNGDTLLTRRLFTAALVDAASGQVSAVAQMPLHLRLLQLARPLHFGDYGGLPLKALWALLDGATIAVLATGLYLWWARRRAVLARRLAAGGRQDA